MGKKKTTSSSSSSGWSTYQSNLNSTWASQNPFYASITSYEAQPGNSVGMDMVNQTTAEVATESGITVPDDYVSSTDYESTGMDNPSFYDTGYENATTIMGTTDPVYEDSTSSQMMNLYDVTSDVVQSEIGNEADYGTEYTTGETGSENQTQTNTTSSGMSVTSFLIIGAIAAFFILYRKK